MNGANVKLTWTISDQASYSEGGQPTSEYEVLILQSDGSTFSTEATYCAASEATLTNLFCEIPMDTLTSAPFSLPLGTLIQAKVAARNSIGLGAYSSLNTEGVLAQTEPLVPSAPTRDAASDQNYIIVEYPFASSDDGGSTILSLNLQWDAATGGVTWTTLIGESPYSTTDSYTVTLAQDGSNEGLTYRFRMRALNIHGWSDYSVWAEILAADVPGVIASTSIELADDT